MKTNILKLGALILSAFTIASCGSEKKFIKVENINNVTQVKHNPLIYSLPKTTVSVKVTAVNEISVKGPYSQFSQKYLGTDDIIKSNSSVWYIGNVEISSFPVKDSARTYVVETNYPCSMSFSENGFLESVNEKSDYVLTDNRNVQLSNNVFSADDILKRQKFQDVNVNRYETVFDTVLHVIDADSIFTTVPTARKQVVRKTYDEQAQELANQIFVLRDDRNALLVGESDGKSLPTGDALKFMIEQLNKLEESYLSMFVGKKIRIEKNYVFNFVPEQLEHSCQILFKFSPEYGIQKKSSLRGEPVMIDITDLNENLVETVYNENQSTLRRKNKVANEQNGFAYLTPAGAVVKILKDGNVISEKILNINQLGIVRYLPQSLMQNENFKMTLYPETGTIKSVN